MTANDVIQNEYRVNPNRSPLATNPEGTAVAAWYETEKRWVIVAATAIDRPGEWFSMEHELLINGAPPAETWAAVPREGGND